MAVWETWLILVILLALIELFTINLATIWFVISGILAMIVSLFIDSYTIQFAIFVIVGVILLITTKPVLTKFIKNKKAKINLDRVIGEKGKVIEKITKSNNGVVKIDGKEWTAYSEETINKNETVEVLEIKGVKLKVKKVEE